MAKFAPGYGLKDKANPENNLKLKPIHRVIITSRDEEGVKETVTVYEVETACDKIDGMRSKTVFISMEEDLLQREQRQYMEKLYLAGELAAGAIHEIKNPLASIRGFVQIIEKSFAQDDDRRNYTRIIIEEIDRLHRLLANFMAFAKPQPAETGPCSINAVLKDINQLIKSKAAANNVLVETELGEGIPDITADKEQLKQVFINIANNAIDAMESGGRLSIRTSMENDKYVKIEFRDTGHGIAPDQVEELFKPFYSTKKDGLGLGLSISKRIVENHSGRIKVETKQGEGTNFIVFLPQPESGNDKL